MNRRQLLKLTALGAASLPLARFAWPSLTPELLRPLKEEAAVAGVELGCALTGWSMNDPELGGVVHATIAREFSLAVIEHGFYMSHLHPYPETWTPATAWRYLDWARTAGLKTRGHALLFPGWATPLWINQEQGWEAEVGAVIREHIQGALSLFHNLDEVVVVNEPYLPNHPTRSLDPFYWALGEDYIVHAFEVAYDEAPPHMKLIYNDTLNHQAYGVNGLTTMLTLDNLMLLDAHGLLDPERFRLGVQMHLRAHDLPDWEDVTRTLALYRERFGVEVIVTEFDCDMSQTVGGPAWRARLHADITAQALRAYLRSGAGRSFTVWGIGDRFSWLETDLGLREADPTLYDDEIALKLAVKAMREVLREEQS